MTCELGAELRRSGERSAARDGAAQAHALATECGATRLTNRRATSWAAPAPPMREPASGVEGLTPSEVRVAELAAEGLTNREVAQSLFVSEKTVETHLGRVYRKLDIKSRHALPGALGERHSADAAESPPRRRARRCYRERHLGARAKRVRADPLVGSVRAAAAWPRPSIVSSIPPAAMWLASLAPPRSEAAIGRPSPRRPPPGLRRPRASPSPAMRAPWSARAGPRRARRDRVEYGTNASRRSARRSHTSSPAAGTTLKRRPSA